MKSMSILLAAGCLWANLAAAQPNPRYQIIDLGTLGGSFSTAYGLNSKGVVSGGSATPSQTGLAQTAFVWNRGHMTNLGTLEGLACPGCSSEAANVAENGDVAVISETSQTGTEDFCAFGTHRQCLAAIWSNGVMKALPTLPGGQNSEVFWINSQGESVGFSETGTADDTCIAPFQVRRFEAVRWTKDGKIQQLTNLPSDTVSFAFANNANGDVVGVSGLCENVVQPPNVPSGPHGVLWDKHGSPTGIPSLGGSFTVPAGVNDNGDVSGTADTPDGALHAFIWSKHGGIRDLGVPDGDFVSIIPCCNAMNNHGDVVAFSCPGPEGNCRAVLWHKEHWLDLNDLALPGSPLYLTGVATINDSGQIAGYGQTGTGETHAFLAIPAQTRADAGQKDLTVQSRSMQLDGTQSTSADGKGLTYVWTIPAGYPSAAILGGSTATPTVQFSAARGVYAFQLTVIDSYGTTSTDVVRVNYAGF
jgi:probable HAF family extracellular repeat protein